MTTRLNARLSLLFDAYVDVSKQCKTVHGRRVRFRLEPLTGGLGYFAEVGDGIADAGH